MCPSPLPALSLLRGKQKMRVSNLHLCVRKRKKKLPALRLLHERTAHTPKNSCAKIRGDSDSRKKTEKVKERRF
jgi:hypothetical protein